MCRGAAIVLAVVLVASFNLAAVLSWVPYDGETRCYDELGCLNITKDWYHFRYRPLNVFPLSRSTIDTKFILFTRNNTKQSQGQILKAGVKESIEISNFDPMKETKFIVHGFIDTSLADWIEEMCEELLINSDWNVIAVDWGGGSLPMYTQASANTRLVGMEIAYLINYLKDNFGLKTEDVHIIGHSLGAHTAGYAGQLVEGLGRITGLDPAEPFFQNMPTHVRLDPSDANFVDVIHTDASPIAMYGVTGYGMTDPVGHLDFYPNGGSDQPGCEESVDTIPLTAIQAGMEEASRLLVACNHCRAITYFIESINGQCPFVGYRCATYQDFLAGRCFSCSGTGCAEMGLHAHKKHSLPLQGSKYYSTTSKNDPFCRYHYRVTLDLAKPLKVKSSVQGVMKATLYSDLNVRTLDLTPSGSQTFQLGKPRRFIVSHRDMIGPVKELSLFWKSDCFFWCDHIYVKSVKVEEPTENNVAQRSNYKGENEESTTLCSLAKKYTDIPSEETSIFTSQCAD